MPAKCHLLWGSQYPKINCSIRLCCLKITSMAVMFANKTGKSFGGCKELISLQGRQQHCQRTFHSFTTSSTPLPLPCCLFHHGTSGQCWAPSWPPNYLRCKSVFQVFSKQLSTRWMILKYLCPSVIVTQPWPPLLQVFQRPIGAASWVALIWTRPASIPSDGSVLRRNNLKTSQTFTCTDQRRDSGRS